MTETRLPDIYDMEAWRDEGRFVCRCRTPHPEYLGLWEAWQCTACGKPIVR